MEYNLKIIKWNVINVDNEIIATITTTINDIRVASEKLKFKFPRMYRFLRLEKVRSHGNLGCDVELGGVGNTLKYSTILIVGGGIFYAMYKFNLFGGLKWLKDAFKDLAKAPETIAKWEDGEVGARVDQVDKIIGILKIKGDKNYSSLYSEWNGLKNEAVGSYGKESFKKTFYESAKMTYLGSKSSKEKLMGKIDTFRTKALTELRALQARKSFRIDSKWNVIGSLDCFPCFF